jgi:hypothetical protein
MNPNFKMAADTRFLRQKLEAVAAGGVISYADLEAAVSKKLDKIRPALASARRSLLNEDNIVFDVVRGVGLKRLNDVEIVDASQGDVNRIRRTARKSIRKLAAIDDYSKLPPKQQLDHHPHVDDVGDRRVHDGTEDETSGKTRDRAHHRASV